MAESVALTAFSVAGVSVHRTGERLPVVTRIVSDAKYCNLAGAESTTAICASRSSSALWASVAREPLCEFAK